MEKHQKAEYVGSAGAGCGGLPSGRPRLVLGHLLPVGSGEQGDRRGRRALAARPGAVTAERAEALEAAAFADDVLERRLSASAIALAGSPSQAFGM